MDTLKNMEQSTLNNNIIHVNIKQVSPAPCCKINEVWVQTNENDIKTKIFEYYPDELQFNNSELIGLTVQQALSLRSKKDIAYLQK